MYHPTTRVLAVLELLQSHGRLSGPQLAARLEVDVRTVRRYITMLHDLGIPIDSTPGRYGAYQLRPGFKLPPLMFSDDEALALTIGLLTARRMGLTAAAPAAESALAKIERVMPTDLRGRVQALQETLTLDLATAATPPPGDVLLTVSMAAQQRRSVELRYRAFGGAETVRMFDPYGLVFRQGYWYAAGWCHLRDELRTLRLDRLISAALLDRSFTRPSNFDAAAIVLHALATTPGKWGIEIVLRTTLAEAQQMIPPGMALLEPLDDGVLLRCWVQRLGWFTHWVAGVECDLIVREPPELRQALADLAVHVARLASSDSCDQAIVSGASAASR